MARPVAATWNVFGSETEAERQIAELAVERGHAFRRVPFPAGPVDRSALTAIDAAIFFDDGSKPIQRIGEMLSAWPRMPQPFLFAVTCGPPSRAAALRSLNVFHGVGGSDDRSAFGDWVAAVHVLASAKGSVQSARTPGSPATGARAEPPLPSAALEPRSAPFDGPPDEGSWSGVAHAINNPLASIQVNLEMLSEEISATSTLSSECVEMVAAAQRGVERIHDVMQRLRHGDGDAEVAAGPIDVNAALRRAVDALYPELRSMVTIETTLEDIPLAFGFRARLEDVLVQMLINAAHAPVALHTERRRVAARTYVSPSGHVAVEVRLTTGLADGRSVDGAASSPTGTEPAGSQSVGTPPDGTEPTDTELTASPMALGMPLCRHLIALMGGQMDAGICRNGLPSLRVLLRPSSRSGSHPAQVIRTARTPPGHLTQRTASPVERLADTASPRVVRVLIVDDEPTVQRGLARALKLHHVDMVSSATAALERLATNDPYDVVLCDLLLPGMTGIEFHRVVAGQYPEYAPRFVFVTAATHVPEAERYLASVPNERLGKPFRVSDVRSVVQRVSSMLG